MKTNTIIGLPKARFICSCASAYAICAALALPALAQAKGAEPQEVKVSQAGTVDISVQDTDLATVLQMLSIESKKNIIAGKGVSGTVTANLYGVTLHEALKAILDVNGFTYYEKGNFIYVITKDEEQAMIKASRKTASRIFELQYLATADANEFIQPLLSPDGKASARGEVTPGFKPDPGNGGEDSNAFSPRLVVNDYPDNLDGIAALLNELDVPPTQVLVEATIIQTSLNEANAFGVDFTVLGSLNFTDITNPISAVSNLLGGNDPKTGFQPADNKAIAAQTTVGNTTGPGGLKIGILTDDVAVFLRVLDEVTDTTVLARPKVMALNRQRAEVLVGARVGYLSTTSTETTTTQSVQFLDTGIQLVFRPFVSKDGMIRMELKPSVSEASLRAVTDATGAVVTIPDELTNQVTTNVRIKDGQTLVLGGLFKDSNTKNHRTVPLLGDIPVVGAAFQGQDDKIERSEVIFLITPSIVQDEKLWAIGAEHLANLDDLRVGARAGLLPFSEEKVISNYNQKAMDAYARGDRKQAEHYISKSLNVMPNQPDMIHMRETIAGDRTRAHDASLMERIFRKEMSTGAAPAPAASQPGMAMTPTFDAPDAASAMPWPASDPSSDSNSDTQTADAPDMNASADESSKPENTEETSSPTAGVSDESNPQPDWGTSTSADDGTSTEPPHKNLQSSIINRAQDTFAARSNTPVSLASNSNARQAGSTLSPQQVRSYTYFLHQFFMSAGMPGIAATYACAQDVDSSNFPFATFADSTKFAGMTESRLR